MSNFATTGLLVALAICAVVVPGYFFGPALLKRTPPPVRRVLGAIGLVLLFLLWGAMTYESFARHGSLIAWVALMIIGAIGLLRTILKTNSKAPTARGPHA